MTRLTNRDWLTFPDDGHLYEILDGALVRTAPQSIEHQRISRELQHVLHLYLERTQLGEMLNAPVGVRLGDEDVFEPDLVVILNEHADRIGTQAIEGAPDLVVEILSPGSAKRDLGTKRQKYQDYGAREYWIVDPESRSIEVLSLERGSFARFGLYRRSDSLASPLLVDLRIPLDEVFVRA